MECWTLVHWTRRYSRQYYVKISWSILLYTRTLKKRCVRWCALSLLCSGAGQWLVPPRAAYSPRTAAYSLLARKTARRYTRGCCKPVRRNVRSQQMCTHTSTPHKNRTSAFQKIANANRTLLLRIYTRNKSIVFHIHLASMLLWGNLLHTFVSPTVANGAISTMQCNITMLLSLV